MDHKEMAAIAADRLAGRQPEDDDVPMENMLVDDPAPTPSSAPSSPVHCTMTIGEARAQYMDRVRQMREEQFREAQADAAYNHHLLQEHLQEDEQIAVERARTAPPARAASSAGGTACGWRRLRPPTKRLAKRAMKRARRYLARPRTRQRTMPAPTSPRSAGVDEALLRRGPAAPTTRQRTPPAPPRPRPANNEAEDIAGSAEAPPCRQRGGGFPPLR